MATELASAYISLSLETSRIPAQVRTALNGVGRQADQAGRDAGNRFSSGMSSGLKTLAGAAGITAGVAGVTAAFKSALTTGMDFTTSMNTMQSVSSASAAQMQKVSAAARQLANDTSLPATSATDAASAMVELAKGGFTVEQSMQAARGTLQLAAAAQIDAATAATIQSQALQAFGKSADYAGTTADILANAANASSAEITDVAAALQQSGTVANQFGLTMTDTAAAIALMANAGIQGSDAGTLLKSALLALTDQGKPAQGAIEELGLQVYDAQGKFVGLSKLFGDLNKASKTMTAEQYQAATATLFGSDAMRLAGIAAQSGAEGYDAMVVAMGRQGSAAEVAAAKTRGLPGAWERFKNAVESASLTLYDAIQGPLTAGLESASGGVNKLVEAAQNAAPAVGAFLTRVKDAAVGAYTALRDSGKLEEWGNRLKNIWSQLSEAVSNVAPIFLQFSQIAAKAAAAMGFAAWESLLAVLESVSTILNVAVVPVLQLLADIAGASETATIALVAAFMLFKTVPAVMASVRGAFAPITAAARNATTQVRTLASAQGAIVQTSNMGAVSMGRFGSAIATLGQSTPVIARMQQSFVNAAAGASHFARTAGTVRAAGSGLAAAGSSIAGVFGGPVGLAFTAAAIGGMAWMSAVQQQKAATEAYETSLKTLAKSQQEVTSSLLESYGSVNQDVFNDAKSSVNAYMDTLDKESKRAPGMFQKIVSFATNPIVGTKTRADELEEVAKKAGSAAEAIQNLGLTEDQLTRAITGGAGSWQGYGDSLRGMGDAGKKAADGLQQLRDNFLQSQESGRRLSPGILELNDAMRVFADTTSSASDKSNALKTALDRLAGVAPDKQEALNQYNNTIRQVAETTAAAWDQTQGFGDALKNQDGTVNTATANGSKLYESLKSIRDATVDAAAAGNEMGPVFAQNEEQFAALARSTGLPIEAIQNMARQMGYIPSAINTTVSLQGGDEASRQLGAISEKFNALPNNGQPKIIEVVPSDLNETTRTELEALGFELKEIDKNGVKTVQVTATENATPLLNGVVQQLLALDGTTAGPKVDLNKEQFNLKDEEAKRQLDALSVMVVQPQAGLIIDKLLAGKAVSAQELAILDQTQTNPKVDMAIDLIMQKIGLVNAELDRAAIARQVQFNITTGSPNGYGGTGAAAELRGTGADGGFRAYAAGGINNLPKSAMIQNPKANLVQWAEPETGGEAFIPLAPSKRKRSLEIWQKTGELLGAKFQTFENGGIRASDFDDLAKGGFGASRPLTGAPYDWGGINWGDCSGAMSAFANLAAGLPVWGSRFATGNEADALAQRGARPGRGSAGDLIFGWLNGGPGGGHTAGILPSGRAVEMGGGNDGGMYGGNPNFGQFTDWAHFPASMFGPSWTDPGSDPGGFVTRPDGTVIKPGDADYSASGSGSSSTSSVDSSSKPSSISDVFAAGASGFVKGQVQDLLGIFQIPDSPAALDAYNQYTSETEQRRKQWDEAKKSRSELESQQRSEMTTPPSVAPSNPSPNQLLQDAQVTYDPSKGAAQWEPYMLRVLDMLTLPHDLLSKFREQVDIESGGDPNAVNTGYSAGGGHPSGLTQTLPDTFNAFKSQDLADNIFDPLANLFAGANYVQNDPKYAGRGMAAIWPTTAGYANGGPIRGLGGPKSDSVPLWGSNGEFMHTAEDYKRNRWAVHAIHNGATLEPVAAGRNSGPSVTYNIQAGNTERAFNQAQRREKQRAAIGLGRI